MLVSCLTINFSFDICDSTVHEGDERQKFQMS